MKNRIKQMMTKKGKCRMFFLYLILPFWGLSLFSCDYLDVVPDNIPTVEHAFRTRTEAQNYKYGCFSFMPDVGNMAVDPAMLGGDEVWIPQVVTGAPSTLRGIIAGEQGTANPLANYWASQRNSQTNVARPLWTGISDCNIFLENIDKPFDLKDYERDKWIGEVLFLKAYLHYWLFRQYGPIPLIRENKAIDDGADEVQQHREPVDSCVNYIASLLDGAAALLPLTVEDFTSDQGLPDRCIALALKAELLTLAASPLFNCNPDYADYVDNRGIQLFPQDKSQEKTKWERAATALKAAIDAAHEAGYDLYDFQTAYPAGASLSDETKLAMQVRGAATEVWNREIIWGNSRINNNYNLQRMCSPFYTTYQVGSGATGCHNYTPPLQIVEQFYTDNGLPVEDDAEWIGRNAWELRTAEADHKQYIRQGYQTIQLHFNREPRFYGAISFDGGTLFGNSRITQDNSTNTNYMWVTEMKMDQLNGWNVPDRSSLTGYIVKKMIHYRSSIGDNSHDYIAINYAFPIIRLGSLYLLYAEALNELKDAPDAQVYEYIDLVRVRTGLEGVVKTWNEHAVADKRNKPLTKEGMRDIIRRERLNELAFEGARFWDLRRWKLAGEYMNRPIRGLNIMGASAADFYVETVLYQPRFETKDYFFPVRTQTLTYNLNLLQSPGW
jgi:hypothetical protein